MNLVYVELLKRHPRPWLWETSEGEDEHIVDCNGKEVLGVSEWLRCSGLVRDFIIDAINNY